MNCRRLPKVQGGQAVSSVTDLTAILAARARGCDLIETPSVLGGIFVDDTVIEISEDLAEVAKIGFNGEVDVATKVMLGVMRRALTPDEDGNIEDPFDAVRDWLDGWLEFDQRRYS